MRTGRPQEYDRDRVLDAAMELFWCQGYDGTSLEHLLASMRLSKSSFYRAFGGKHKVFCECLRVYNEHTLERLNTAIDAAPSAIDFIESMLTDVVDEGRRAKRPRGCFIANTATEFAQFDPVIAKDVADGMAGFNRVFRRAIERGQLDASIRPELDAAVTAMYLVTTMSGLRTMVKAGTAHSALDRTVSVVIEGLRSR